MKDKSRSETYSLKMPECYAGAVMGYLNDGRGFAIKNMKKLKNADGELCEVIFTCEKIAGFPEWLHEATHGEGRVELLR